MFEPGDPTRIPGSAAQLWADHPIIPQQCFDGGPNLPRAVSTDQRTHNPLRPSTFDEVVGQDRAVRMMRRVIGASKLRTEPLDHVLLVAGSGTGKSTFSHVIANELGVRCFEAEAPVSHEALLAFREAMEPGDILRIEEIHQQAIMERRGRSAGTEPEVLYNVLEDRTIVSGSEILPFPRITVIGTTTDEGMLPDPFINRFPLRPRLEPYTTEQLAQMAVWNAERMGLPITSEASILFAAASRGVPRQVNNYVKNAVLLADGLIDEPTAREVLEDLNGVTDDGLNADMQGMIVFLYTKGKRTNGQGEVTYQASVSTVATALGKSRDAKAVALRVEPYLIEQGHLQVGHGGRILTDKGVERARELIGESNG
jgi:Holliday junction DNA helicase RuvB